MYHSDLVNTSLPSSTLSSSCSASARCFKDRFENYVKANDVVLRNMQNQGQGLQNQIANLTDMLSKFVNANTASSSGTGTLPSNTVTNPKEDLKGINHEVVLLIRTHDSYYSSPLSVDVKDEISKGLMPSC
ncbi:hypothetical protein Tco_0377190 [Tanacetum coccineum]